MKKLFYRVKGFFHRIHVGFVQWFALFFLRHTNKGVRRLLAVSQGYLDLNYLSTTLLSLTNDVVRRHIINAGKNPDYVPPPPLPAPVSVPSRTYQTTLPNNYSSIGGGWVSDPKTHPVLKSRAIWDAKQNPPPSDPQAVEAPPSTENVVEVGGQALDALRGAIYDIEQGLDLAPAEDKKTE